MDAPSLPRSPWQRLYESAHRLRHAWYAGRSRRLPVPVVSIGNLHWGGSGKTPLVAAVAAHRRDRGEAVCVLSRGYRGQGRAPRVLSRGAGPLLTPRQAGDEPVLLAELLPGVAVVVGTDRTAAGALALAELRPAPQLLLLDDGFSHLALGRDLDLLAFPAADPFAGGRLLPSGRLREPLRAAARASAAVLTGVAPAALDGAGAALAAALRPFGFAGPGFASAAQWAPARLENGELLLPGTRVLALSAIARPADFVAAVRRLDFAVMGELRFPDHYRYPAASLARIARAARQAGAEAVLTTAKDLVKLRGRLGVPVAELPLRAEPEPELWRWLDGALAALPAPGVA
jgi:tetraacyldisaccharide 4'-kinase